MQRTTVKQTFLVLALASALPLAACSRNNTPTSPTQPGPTVTATPPPPPTDDRPIVSITGVVVNLSRSGAGDLDITFRIDDFTIVRANANTPVESGSDTFRTDAVRNGQTVTAEGRRDNGFLDATRVVILAQAPQ
jgi:hypothetical protein